MSYFSEEEKKDEPLVIPLLGSKTWHDRIVNKIDADIFETKTKENEQDIDVKQEEKPELINGNASLKNKSVKKPEVAENNENKVITLEEQAAKEIIADLISKKDEQVETKNLTLPLVGDESLRGKDRSGTMLYTYIYISYIVACILILCYLHLTVYTRRL